MTSLLYTNDVILTNHRVCTMMTLNILRSDKNKDFHTQTQNSLRRCPVLNPLS